MKVSLRAAGKTNKESACVSGSHALFVVVFIIVFFSFRELFRKQNLLPLLRSLKQINKESKLFALNSHVLATKAFENTTSTTCLSSVIVRVKVSLQCVYNAVTTD